MRTLPTLALLPLMLMPFAADAARDCRHEAPRNLALDLAGVDSVQIEIGPHDLTLAGHASGDGRVEGRACASEASRLDELQITQERSGSRLILRATSRSQRGTGWWLFGRDSQHAHLEFRIEIPTDMPVMLAVGSGDARIEGLDALDLNIGSGDAHARGIRSLRANVGSGDLVGTDIGGLRVRAVGSGDVVITGIDGDVEVGNVGSGDLVLRQVRGDITIGSIGSGDVAVHDVTGSVRADSIGSGDLVARDIGGDLVLRRKGSGDVRHSGVRGTVDVPMRR
jgi:hypothetical protein